MDEIQGKIETLEKELAHVKEQYDIKCDEFREQIVLNSKLRGLLASNGVDHEL